MIRIAALFIVAAGALIGFLAWQQTRTAEFTVSGFVEADEIRIGSRVGGRVAQVHVEEGAAVKKGEPVFDLDPFNLSESLARAEAQAAAARAEVQRLEAGFRPEEIEQARARQSLAQATLDKLVAGPRAQEIAIAEEQLNAALAALQLAEFEHERLEKLRKEQQAASTEYESALRSHKAAQADVAGARQRLALLKEGTRAEEIAEAKARLAEATGALDLMRAGYRSEDIAQAQARLRAAEAEVAYTRAQLDELAVLSPCDCIVEAVGLRPGDLVSPNAPSASLLDLSRMWVRAYVPESRLAPVPPGRRVAMRFIGLPDHTVIGHVVFVAREAEFTPRNVQTPEERSKQVFRVKVVLENPPAAVRVGMSADLHFDEPVPPS